MEITIRGREPHDAAAYQRLYSHPDVYPWTLQLPFPSVATWEKKFLKMDAEGFIAFVAEIDGETLELPMYQVGRCRMAPGHILPL